MGSFDEDRKHYKQVMGDDLGSLYHGLWNDGVLLHMRWSEHEQLFWKGPAEFEQMHDWAGGSSTLLNRPFGRAVKIDHRHLRPSGAVRMEGRS